MKNPSKNIQNKLINLPELPGVYLMKDKHGNIIYIGKAGSLKKRVSSYFQANETDLKLKILKKIIYDFDYLITDSEIEALLLESTLIKKHKPRYNIKLKDDKRYPYIVVTLSEDFPRVIITRRLSKNNNRYFGPYTDANAARKIVSTINTVFKLKTCKREFPLSENERPCLNYQMKKCRGVCQGEMSREEYRSIVENAVKFLLGDIKPVISNLTDMMNVYSKNMLFELAAQIRDIIYDIQKISEKQKVYMPIGLDQDYIGVSVHEKEAIIIIFEFRNGVMLGRKISILENVELYEHGEIIKSFLIDYYESNRPPARIITQYPTYEKGLVLEHLKSKVPYRITISKPRSKTDKSIIDLILKNIESVVVDRLSYQKSMDKKQGLLQLKDIFNMDKIPNLIECFDISNIQGKYAVASMVRFRGGEPEKKSYRRYRIKSYDSPNDPGMIHEVFGRRVQYLINEEVEIPDLFVIDGGRSQLNRALEIKKAFDLDVRIVSIAKRFEEIYIEDQKDILKLPKTSPALKIIQNIRDEAHRFAITYHKEVRSRDTRKSVLDSIPDIGEKRKMILLQHMKSIETIENSTIQSLESLPGIGRKTAEIVYNFFHDV